MRGGYERALVVGWCVLLVLGGTTGTAGASVHDGDGGFGDGGRIESNQPPLAEAGLDRSVPTNGTVFLDATGSVDPDGSITEYEWRVETPNGSVVRPVCPTCARTRFVARQAGQYDVTVTVTDDDGAQRSDTLYVTASEPDGPAVRLSGPTGVLTDETHTYSASASAGEATLARVLWFVDDQRVAEASVAGESATPELSHAFARNGTRELRVEVVDRLGRRASATRTITVEAADENHAPTAGGLEDRTVQSGGVVTFTVETSDADGDALTYRWWVADTSAPDFTDETGPDARVRMPAVETETDYEVVVRVRDGNGGSTTATAEVTVEPESDGTEGSDPSENEDDSTGDSATGETCSPASGERCNGPPRYLDADRYRTGACTMGPQGAREDCADQQYAHTGSQYMLVDNDGDHEITFDVGPATLLVGIIPQQSDIAVIFVQGAALERIRTRAWRAYWDDNLSRRAAAVVQGDPGNEIGNT